MKKLPLISRAEYNTILLHTEKINNGQHDFVPVLRRELHDKLNIDDAESLIVDLVRNKDVEFLNRVRLFLSQFPFIVESEKGVRYQLVKRGNFCELDFVEETAELTVDDTPAQAIEDDTEPIELMVEEITLETRADRIRQLQADVQRGIIEIGFELIAAKKEIGHGSWADWLKSEFNWGIRTAQNFMALAERFGNTKSISFLSTTTLIKMLALPKGDEQAFIEAQAQAGKPVENQSAREVQAAVKQWKQTKNEEVSQTVEVADQSQSVGESEGGIIIKEKSAPIQNSDSLDADLERSSIEEILIVNSSEKDSGVDLKMKRVETQKLLDEISVLIQTAADTKLDETIINLKSIRDVLNASC